MVRYGNRFFQIESKSRNSALGRRQVLVCQGRHGGLTIEYRGGELRFQEIAGPAGPQMLMDPRKSERKDVAVARTQKWVPPPNHPWREMARREVEKRALKQAAACNHQKQKTKIQKKGTQYKRAPLLE